MFFAVNLVYSGLGNFMNLRSDTSLTEDIDPENVGFGRK